MKATVEVTTTRMSGLTSCLIETVRACYDPAFEHQVIIMMPENLSLNGEQEIIDHITGTGLLGIRIITPKRIFDEICDQAGRPVLEPMTDFGRAVALSHVLKLLHRQGTLEFYDNAIRQTSLPVKLAEQIDEFRDAGLSPQQLLDLAEHPEIADAMRYKYRDIARIWANYLTETDSHFLDAYQQWDDMLSRLEISRYFENADFIIAGFSMLNQHLMRLLSATSLLATSTRLIIVADETGPDARIFSSVNNQILTLGQYLFDRGIRMLRKTYEHLPKTNPAIQFIERTLFAGGHRTNVPRLDGVEVYTAKTPFIECQHAAQTLIAWHQQGMRWREMAVSWNSTDILPDLLPMVLRDAGIPCTPAAGQSMLMNDYVQFVLCTVRAVCLGFAQSDMLGMIKSGFCLTPEDAMDLENYAIEHGINRQKWVNPFQIPDTQDPSYHFVCRMEDCRLYLQDILVPLRKVLANRKSTGQDQAKAIYEAMDSAGAYQTLRNREQAYMSRGMMLESDRNRQVWDVFNDVLDQLAVYSRTRHISLEELPVMLESAFSASVVKSLPQTSDAVTLNPPGMFFSSSIRGMILMGMQDRDTGAGTELLSDTERETFRHVMNTSFGMTRQERAGLDMERISNTIAVTRERLVFSCSLTKPDGSMLYPSSVMRMVSGMLKTCGMERNISGGMMDDGILPYSPSIALERVSTRLRAALQGQDDLLTDVVPEDGSESADPDDADKRDTARQPADADAVWRRALAFLYHDPMWHNRTARMLKGLSACVHVDDLTPDMAHRLYPETNLSISRLETFAACPYHHFLTYGLRPVIRQPFSFMASMRGEFYHAVMEAYIRKASVLSSWPNLSDREMRAILDEVIGPLTEKWRDGPLDVDALRRFHAEHIIRDVRHAAAIITRNFSVSDFVPTAYELRFGRPTTAAQALPPIQFNLKDGTGITLNGQIDRLDTFVDKDGTKYFRVVDYKSSQHVLRDAMLEEGLQLQIPIYLNAVQQAMPDALPAGGLYQVIGNPLIDAEDNQTDLIAKKMGSELKLKGIVLEDPAILAAMGEVNGRSRSEELVAAIPMQEIVRRMEGSMKTARNLSEGIFGGRIQIAPVRYDENSVSPCEYCPGAPICGIDSRLPGGSPRCLKVNTPESD